MTPVNNTGNGLLRKIPWSIVFPVILAVGGWISFVITFYNQTNIQLSEHSKQLASFISSREKLLDQYNLRLDRMNERAEKLADELHSFMARVDRLDTPLSRKVEAIQKLIDVYNDRINAITSNLNVSQTSDQARHEQMQKQVDALIKRDDQLLQALDAQYNALNEHLRAHGTPGGLPRSR
jgi:ABC-type transporter Mla subunit MlaD